MRYNSRYRKPIVREEPKTNTTKEQVEALWFEFRDLYGANTSELDDRGKRLVELFTARMYNDPRTRKPSLYIKGLLQYHGIELTGFSKIEVYEDEEIKFKPQVCSPFIFDEAINSIDDPVYIPIRSLKHKAFARINYYKGELYTYRGDNFLENEPEFVPLDTKFTRISQVPLSLLPEFYQYEEDEDCFLTPDGEILKDEVPLRVPPENTRIPKSLVRFVVNTLVYYSKNRKFQPSWVGRALARYYELGDVDFDATLKAMGTELGGIQPMERPYKTIHQCDLHSETIKSALHWLRQDQMKRQK